MLKKISSRHRSVMRRLIVGEKPGKIAKELVIAPATISQWIKDPLFASELIDMEQRATDKMLSDPDRLDALKIINDAAGLSAKLCVDTMKDEGTDITLRMKSAWDILDRNPETAKTTKQVRANVDLTELIIEAARKREERDAEKIPFDDPDVIEAEAEAM